MAWEPQTGTPDPNVAALPVRLVGIGDSSGGIGSLYTPPSSKTGRTAKHIAIDNQTTGQSLYSVTAGKTLYILSVFVSGFNTGQSGRLRIKDDTTVLLTIHALGTGLGILGGMTPFTAVPAAFVEPMKFTTNVTVDIPTGTLTYSITLIGYEE
jgi:hypothetical protein